MDYTSVYLTVHYKQQWKPETKNTNINLRPRAERGKEMNTETIFGYTAI